MWYTIYVTQNNNEVVYFDARSTIDTIKYNANFIHFSCQKAILFDYYLNPVCTAFIEYIILKCDFLARKYNHLKNK